MTNIVQKLRTQKINRQETMTGREVLSVATLPGADPPDGACDTIPLRSPRLKEWELNYIARH